LLGWEVVDATQFWRSIVTTAEATWAWLYQPLQDLKAQALAEPDKSWDERRAEFIGQLGLADPAEHPVADELVRRLDELPDEERGALLTSEELDSFAYRVIEEQAPAEEGGAPSDDYDEQAWTEYLASAAPQWDGTEESWEQFHTWFLHHAAERGIGTPAQLFLDYVAAMSNDDRITTFAAYGITIQPAAPEQPAAGNDAVDRLAALDAELLAEHPELASVPTETRMKWAAEAMAELANG
jgi:hypothetical protein